MLKTQQECMDAVRREFIASLMNHADILHAYSYRDDRARRLIQSFMEKVKLLGLQFSNCFHANGIGNNNQYTISLSDRDADGFVLQKNVATFYFCYGIFGGCYVSLENLASGEKLTVGHAR